MEATTTKHSMSVSSYWKKLSQSCLTDKEVHLLAGYLDWKIVSESANLEEKTWTEFGSIVHSEGFAKNPHVTAKVFNRLNRLPDWRHMEERRKIDDDFLLNINTHFFETVHFATINSCAKEIDEKTWQQLMERNGRELLRTSDANERSDMLHSQLMSMESLDHYRKLWSWQDWKVISAKQRLTFEFVKKNWIFLHTRKIKEKNPFHQLSTEQLKKIREFVSNEVDKEIQGGNEPSWKLIYEEHLLTRAFLEKYKEKFAGILAMY